MGKKPSAPAREKQAPKLTLGEKEHLLAEVMDGVANEASSGTEPWPHHYAPVELSRGARVPVEIQPDDSLIAVRQSEIISAFLSWNRRHTDPAFLMTHKQAKEVAAHWLAASKAIPADEIAPIRWKGEHGFTWRKLPWEPVSGPSPTWDEMLSRMTNATAFKAFLGSLFFDFAAQHQYAWVYGSGGDGKGAINRFLARVIGPSYCAKQPPGREVRFWTYGLIGKRLCVFPDCNAQGFTAGGLFKSLSGGDPVDVEAKGEMAFTTKMVAKYLFFSNEKPDLSSENADMRRVIYCEFIEKGRFDPSFEQKLWEEGGTFLTSCIETYRRLCPNHGAIPTATDQITDHVSALEEPFELFFDQYFKPAPAFAALHANLVQMTEEQLDKITVRRETLVDRFRANGMVKRRDQLTFKSWMERKYGARVLTINHPTIGSHRRYVGLMLREVGFATGQPSYLEGKVLPFSSNDEDP